MLDEKIFPGLDDDPYRLNCVSFDSSLGLDICVDDYIVFREELYMWGCLYFTFYMSKMHQLCKFLSFPFESYDAGSALIHRDNLIISLFHILNNPHQLFNFASIMY